MDATHYSIAQLLAIRGSKLQTSIERKLLDEAKDNPVLTDILRHKHLGRHQRLPFLSRNNMELRKSSSAESEGHEPTKPQAPQVTVPVRDKASRQTVRHTVGDVSQLDGQAGRQLDGQDAEPDIPPEAPQRPVLPDQKRKGFEQFYEAVRSPTHVRVTAGGRIVPNTLEASHSSPTGKGSRERFVGDVNGAQLPSGQTFNSPPFLPGPPLMGPMHPTMHSAFSMMTTGPSPMPPFGGFAMPPFALPQIPSQTAFSHPAGVGHPAGNLEDNKEHENSAVPTRAPLPMPPLGGQWLIPPQSMMLMGMPFPGGPMMPMAFSPMGQPILYQQQPLQPAPATGTRSFSPTSQTEGCPASSIRPSIITKNQLAGLRSSLKKAEAQLAYNRHQIDEMHMEEYARQLRSDIEHFEIKLKGELALEDTTLPHRNDAKDKSDSNVFKASKSATDSHKTLLSSTADAESTNEPVGNAPAKTTTEEQKVSKPRKKDRVHLAVDTSIASAPFLNSNIFASISPVPFDPAGLQQQQGSDHVHKPSTGLPVSAARAPVFQPRLDPRRPSENTPPVSALMNGEKDTRGTRFHGPVPTNFEESRLLFSMAPPTPADDMEDTLEPPVLRKPILNKRTEMKRDTKSDNVTSPSVRSWSERVTAATALPGAVTSENAYGYLT
ncbi:hypothetical protein LX36DRAFT_747965 [Colletotrichum falcatum]|nr:hypothetical protein LX36DRAFT_747965 [Colletotrichum falcatum]